MILNYYIKYKYRIIVASWRTEILLRLDCQEGASLVETLHFQPVLWIYPLKIAIEETRAKT